MEKNTKDAKAEFVCSGANCQNGMAWHGYHRFFVLRWVLGLMILAGMFIIGVKVGELKALLESDFGIHHNQMMYRSGNIMFDANTSTAKPGMMLLPNGVEPSANPTTIPSTK